MAKSTLLSLPSLSPTPPPSSRSSAPITSKESLPLQKKYAIVQEISKQKREKYGKMFIPTEFYATLRKKDENPQPEVPELSKDKITTRKNKYLSYKQLAYKKHSRRPSFEIVEKVHQQHTEVFKPSMILPEIETLSKPKEETIVRSPCSSNYSERCHCKNTSESHTNSKINKDTYADRTRIAVDPEMGCRFVVEKISNFNYKVKKIDDLQQKNATTEEELIEETSVDRSSFNQNKPSVSMELKELSQALAPDKIASQNQPTITSHNTRPPALIAITTDTRKKHSRSSASYYQKADHLFDIQPKIRLAKQTISHPPIRAASLQHSHQPRKFHPIVLEPPPPPYHHKHYIRNRSVLDPRRTVEHEYFPYFPYDPYAGPIYKGQYPNIYPRSPYRQHLFPQLQREPVFYHHPSMWAEDVRSGIQQQQQLYQQQYQQHQHQHPQYSSMNYGFWVDPYRSPITNHGIREMPPSFYPN